MEEFFNVEKRLAEIMVGGTVLSMRIAGEELELHFTGSSVKGLSVFSIDTNSWIFVTNNDDYIEPLNINDDVFFQYRPDAIKGLYELTGYDVKSVKITEDGLLVIKIMNKYVSIIPKTYDHPNYQEQDYWSVIIENKFNERKWIVRFEDGKWYIRE